MKRKLALLLGILGITVGAFAFTVSTSQEQVFCPLKGTPACPEYPRCCQ